ncbi:MAG: hypothetical protein ACREQ7_02680 [Candidatus Binatia bacterium]
MRPHAVVPVVAHESEQLSFFRQAGINRGLEQTIFSAQQADNVFVQDCITDFYPVQIRMAAALVVNRNVAIGFHPHAVLRITVFVAVHRNHGGGAALLEALPHRFESHRPIIVAVHEQKARI